MRAQAKATPSPDEFFARAEALLPAIREAALSNERNRIVAPAIMAKVREAGALSPDGAEAVRRL